MAPAAPALTEEASLPSVLFAACRPVLLVVGAGAITITALMACGGDGKGFGTGVELVVGSASPDRTQFVSVEDGDDVPLVPGSQGGFHVWTGLRLRGVAGIVHLERQARRVSDGELVLLASTMVLELPDQAMVEWWERPAGMPEDAMASFMCPTPVGIRVRDEPLEITAQILTEDGELLAEDSLVFVPRCPEDEEAEFCAEICSG